MPIAIQSPPTLVILESPFGSPEPSVVEANKEYLSKCIRHSTLVMRESPYASHRMLTDALDDNSVEREAGIKAGFAWRQVAAKIVVYLDRGLSRGMVRGLQHALKTGHKVELRAFGEVAPDVLQRLELLGLTVQVAADPALLPWLGKKVVLNREVKDDDRTFHAGERGNVLDIRGTLLRVGICGVCANVPPSALSEA